MKFYITKYALTRGISEVDGSRCEISGRMLVVKTKEPDGYESRDHFHTPDWHADQIAAEERAEQMRTRKLKALRQQIKKIAETEIEIVPFGEG